MNFTFNQKIAFAVAAASFLAAGGSAADLANLFGTTIAKSIASAASLFAGLGGVFLGVVTGQANLVKDVQNMPGVEKVLVNGDANKTLATLAVSEDQPKIEAIPSAEKKVNDTAKGDTP